MKTPRNEQFHFVIAFFRFKNGLWKFRIFIYCNYPFLFSVLLILKAFDRIG